MNHDDVFPICPPLEMSFGFERTFIISGHDRLQPPQAEQGPGTEVPDRTDGGKSGSTGAGFLARWQRNAWGSRRDFPQKT
jgi:hypothetical protein